MKTSQFLLRFFLLLPISWGTLQAQVGTDFTIIADDTQPEFQAGFGTYPSISDDGTVAFALDLDGGTYKSQGGNTAVRVGGSVTGDPFINRVGEIASRQHVDAFLTTELYKTTTTGQLVPLIRNDSDFRTFGGLHLSPTGTAVFYARKNPVSPGHWGIYTATGAGAPSLVVDNLGIFGNFGNGPTINSAGTVAFTGYKDVVNNTSEQGLYVGTAGGNGVTTTVLTADGSPLYQWDGNPYINDRGQIAFKAYEDNTGEPGIFVVNQDGTGLTTIARAGGIGGSGPYSMFDSPVINDLGTVVFRGYLDTGEHGIYAGPDPVAHKVIQEGDALFGSTLTNVLFLRGLNNQNQIAFYFELADGRTGIAKARLTASSPTPTPTPTPLPSATPTPTPLPSATPLPTATATPAPTATATPFPTATAAPTATPGPSATATPSATPGASATPSPSATPSTAAQPLNIATRGRVESGDNAMIGGFIINGSSPKRVVVRAIGPSLQGFLPGALTDPVLELHGANGSLIQQNDNWRDDASQASFLEANNFAPSNALEAALVATLPPGNYTAAVTGKNGSAGVGLVEVYDVNQAADSQLANISTRGVVQSSDNVLIGGFILGGNTGTTKVLVRAIGPSLANFGVANALSDPTLELHDGNGALLQSNDNWKDQQTNSIEATNLAPTANAEAAIVADLAPGAYTAIVAGKGSATGVALVEVYNLR
jgi:hypothetical protein